MPAYLIANVEVQDAQIMKKYMAATPDILKKYTGRFLARGGDIWKAEGQWNPKRLVIVEFDSMELAKAFWHSDEYKPYREMRQSAADTEMVFVEGVIGV